MATEKKNRAAEEVAKKTQAAAALVVIGTSEEVVSIAGVRGPEGGWRPGFQVPIKELGYTMAEAKKVALDHPGAIQFIEGGEK